MTTLFISDLHLSNERPEKLALFEQLLTGPALQAEALYILGDLFEVWAGDDDTTPPHDHVRQLLKNYTASGGQLYVQRGNRDFLLGNKFCHDTGAKLLPDPHMIMLAGKPVLIMHGDLLCTQDRSYQRYRKLVHASAFRKPFLLLPKSLRIGIAHHFRNFTRKLTGKKDSMIMDVDPATVVAVMDHADVDCLIHGHTHRPAIHALQIGSRPAQRIVLGDWYDQDSVLVCDPQGKRLLRIRDVL